MLPMDLKEVIAANHLFWIDSAKPGLMVYLQLNNGLILLQQDTLVEVNDSDKEDTVQHKYGDNNGYA